MRAILMWEIHNRFVQKESSRIPRRKSYLQTWHMTLEALSQLGQMLLEIAFIFYNKLF